MHTWCLEYGASQVGAVAGHLGGQPQGRQTSAGPLEGVLEAARRLAAPRQLGRVAAQRGQRVQGQVPDDRLQPAGRLVVSRQCCRRLSLGFPFLPG